MPATQQCARLARVSQPLILPTAAQPGEEQASFSMVLPPNTALRPMEEFFCKQACVPFPMHNVVGLIFQAGKGEPNTCVFPTLMLLHSSWVHPSYFKVCLHRQSQTRSAANCSYSQALTAFAPTLRAWHCPISLAYTWNLLFPTKLLPKLQNQNRKTWRKLSPQCGFQQIHIHVQTDSCRLALTLESRNREFPFSLIAQILGKNGKNVPTLTCDSTFCYTHWAAEEVRA